MNNITLNYGTEIYNNLDELNGANYEIIIKPLIYYDLTDINKRVLTPILNPSTQDGNFKLDIEDPNIIINSNNGEISLNNLEIKEYSFHVIWNLNNVETLFFINFQIKPEIYYSPNEKYINLGDQETSLVPIFDSSKDYTIICNYPISENGILNFSNFSVGYHKIPVKIKINNIINETVYNLYVRPILKYDSYTNIAFNNFSTDVPYYLEKGGLFNILNEYFTIDSKTGVISGSAPSGIYDIEVTYTKNNISTTCNVNIIINPQISYSNMIIYSDKIYQSNEPISNEIIDGEFSCDLLIDTKTGIVTFDKLVPNTYTINIQYCKNKCITNTSFKVDVKPVLIISKNQDIKYLEKLSNITFEVIPNNVEYILETNKNIIGNDIIIDDVINVGVYSETITLIINNMISSYVYSYSISPIINYNVKELTYNDTFISEPPSVYPLKGTFYISDNFIIDSKTGVISSDKILEVGIYSIDIHYKYQTFDISFNYILTVKPLLIYPDINITFSDSLSIGPTYLPLNGTFSFVGEPNTEGENFPGTFSFVGEPNTEGENFPGAFSFVGEPNTEGENFHVSLLQGLDSVGNLLQGLDSAGNRLQAPDSRRTFDINNSGEIIVNNLNVGLYFCNVSYEVNNIKTTIKVPINIIKKELELDFTVYPKEYDGTTNANVSLSHNNITFNANYTDANCGNKDIIIDNIVLPEELNLNYFIKTCKLSGLITPKIIEPEFIAEDKIYDNNNNVNIKVNIKNIISYTAKYINHNVGEQEIIINNIITKGSNNYKLSSDSYKIRGIIKPRIITVTFSAEDKIYDSTTDCNIQISKIEKDIQEFNLKLDYEKAIFVSSNIGYHEILVINPVIIGSNNYELKINKIMANIYPKKIVLKIIAKDKIYDGTTNANIIFNTEFKIKSYETNYNNKNMGTKKIIYVNNIILENNNFIVDNCTLYGNILPKFIEFNFIGKDKNYDGLTKCDGDYTIDINENDIVNCSFNAEFKNINAGLNKNIIINNLKLYGKDSINYKISSINTNKPSINMVSLNLIFTAIDKMYDKTLTAYVKSNINVISYNAQYEDYNVGINKNIKITDIKLDSDQSINYYVNDTFCLGNINPCELTIISNNNTKEYDGTPNINININHLKGIYHDDIVYIESYDAEFEDDKVINVYNISLQGETSYNYICNNTKLVGSILPKKIVIIFEAEDIYYGISEPIIKNNSYNIKSFDAKYLDLNVGRQSILISNIIIDNYLVDDCTIFGNILPKMIELLFIAEDKAYDGNDTVKISIKSEFNISFDSKFENINVGYNKVLISNIKINDNNYITTDSIEIFANIYPKELFINPTITKIYDGSLMQAPDSAGNRSQAPDLTGYLSQAPDSWRTNLLENDYLATFYSPNVGKNIPVKISNIITKDKNYIIKDFETTGIIEPQIIIPEFIIKDKIYDGTTKVINVEFNIDVVSYSGTYDSPNIGNNKVIIENIKLKDTNYKVENIITNSNILPKMLEINFTVKSKVYDGNNNATIESYKFLNANDNIKILSYIALYDSSNTVIISDLIIDNNNYITKTYTTIGNIKPKILEISFTNLDKYYDKTLNTNIVVDSVSDNMKIESFSSKYTKSNAGTNIEIIINNIVISGVNKNNYFVKDYVLYGNILPKCIDCEFKYNNNLLSGTLNDLEIYDNVWIENYISFQKNNEKYVQNIVLNGEDKNNYVLNNNIYKIISNI